MIDVMLVDDQEPTRLGLSLMLRRDADIRVVREAAHGQQALGQLTRMEEHGHKLPDVVLMDVRMPVLDGIQTTAALCKRWPECRVLVLTTYNQDDYAYGALDAGASGFLLKDVKAVELCRAVRAVAEGDAVLTPRLTRAVLSRAVTVCKSGGEQERLRNAFRALTERERQVCSLVADGYSNAEIGEKLVVQAASVKKAITRILAKLALRDRTQLAVAWCRADLWEEPNTAPEHNVS